MTMPTTVTDLALETMLARRARRADPAGLTDAVFAALETIEPRRGPRLGVPAWWLPSRPNRGFAWIIVAAGLLLALLGSALVGAGLLDRPRPLTNLVPNAIGPKIDAIWSRVLAVSANEAWAAEKRGLWHFVDGSWTGPLRPPGWNERANGWALAPDGTLWVTTDNGVAALRGGQWTVASSQYAVAIAIGPDGTAWAGSGSSIIGLRLDGSPPRTVACPNGAWAMAATTDGSLYVGSWGWVGRPGLRHHAGRRSRRQGERPDGRFDDCLALYAPPTMPTREQTLAAIVDAFAPGGDELPSASELGVHLRLLAEVEALGRPSFSRQLDLLLRLVDSRLGNLALAGRPTRFSSLTQDAREAYLRGLGESRIPLKRIAFQDLKRLTLLFLYGMEDSPWRAMTGYAPPAPDVPAVSRLTVRTPSAGEVVEADAVVIGSGAGGSVAAAVLAAAGRRVVVLERAALVTEERFGGAELDGLADLFLDRGLSATSDRWIAIRAGSAVGGGTVVNWSTSLRAPAAVRDEWRAAGIGDDLDEHFAAVEAEMEVTTAESEPNGPNAKLAAGLAALGLPATVVPRNVQDCGDCGPCAVGCRRGAKRSALRTYLAWACRDGAVILDRTEARRVIVEDGRAAGVVARVPGGEVTVRAPLVALAGGGILSPAVLLRSGISTATAGRNLLLHPVAAAVGVYPEPLEPWSGVPQGVLGEAFAEVDRGWGFRLEAAPTHPGLIASGYPWWGSAGHRAAMARASRTVAFIAIVRDRNGGRVELARDGGVNVRYAPGAPERALLRAGMLELVRLHHAAGARSIVPLLTPPLTWEDGSLLERYLAELARRPIAPNRILLFSAHQMGTCRIGPSARDSVADPDGQVWGVEGLYVTDASAFPTASGVNPMLSIMALARRTAHRMAAG